MLLKKMAVAGTLESGDVQIAVIPNAGSGITIELESSVKAQFGDAIVGTVRQVLEAFDVSDVTVRLQDMGALDCVIQARLRCALCRAAEVRYDWTREDTK